MSSTLKNLPPKTFEEVPDRYLTVRQTAARYGVGVATIWRWAKCEGEFPQPIRLSKGTTRWKESDLFLFEREKETGA